MILDAILNREPTPPVELNSNVSKELQQIIGGAIVKDRELRYQRASVLRADLERMKNDLAAHADASRLGSHSGLTAASGTSRGAVKSKPVVTKSVRPRLIDRTSVVVLVADCLLFASAFAYTKYNPPGSRAPSAKSASLNPATPAEPTPDAKLSPAVPLPGGDTVRVARARSEASQTLSSLTSSLNRLPSSPNSPGAYLSMARTYVQQRRPEYAMASYVVNDYDAAEGLEIALDKLSRMYEDLKRFDLAAESLETLAKRIPQNGRDAAWRAGEIYEEKLKNLAKARELYVQVPPNSPHYRDAQRKLQG